MMKPKKHPLKDPLR